MYLAVLLVIGFLAWYFWPASTRQRQGLVITVQDGDGLIVRSGRTLAELRLAYIDAPELFQTHGFAAKKHLQGLVARKNVRYVPVAVDKYGRTVALVYAGEICVNAAMVVAGFAWAMPSNSPIEIQQLEQQARFARRGLWAARDVMPPWEYRRQAKSGIMLSGAPGTGKTGRLDRELSKLSTGNVDNG